MIQNLLSNFIGPLSFTTIIIVIIGVMLVPSFGKIFASTWEALVEFAKPLTKGLGEAIVFVIKSFFEGLKVCFSNLSTLTVIVVAIIFGGWYFQTWNDNRVKAPLEKRIEELQKKCVAPAVVKKKIR